jgi:hypothetical protein
MDKHATILGPTALLLGSAIVTVTTANVSALDPGTWAPGPGGASHATIATSGPVKVSSYDPLMDVTPTVPPVTTTAAAVAAPTTSASGSSSASATKAAGPVASKTDRTLFGTKHGLQGTATITRLSDGRGRLTVRGTQIAPETPFSIIVYRGLAMPAIDDRVLFAWTSDDARRASDGSLTLGLDVSQTERLMDARTTAGLTVRLHAGTEFADARFAR